MNKLGLDQLKKLVLAIVLMIIGILFCCSLAMGITGLSMVVGFLLLIIGILYIANSLLISKNFLTTNGIIGIAIFTLGILFMVNKLAGIIVAFIPWFLIVLGTVIIIDAFLGKFLREENNLTYFIIKIVIGAVSLILGLCLKLIDNFAEYSAIILGILMIIIAGYLVFNIFTNKSVRVE